MSQQHEPNPETLFCPRCGSTDVRRARGEGILAFCRALFGQLPFRCRSCRVKFFKRADAPGEEHQN